MTKRSNASGHIIEPLALRAIARWWVMPEILEDPAVSVMAWPWPAKAVASGPRTPGSPPCQVGLFGSTAFAGQLVQSHLAKARLPVDTAATSPRDVQPPTEGR